MRLGGRDDLIAFDLAPDLQRLFLGFLFFAADVGDDVVEDLRPVFEGLAGAGNGLVRADEDIFHTVLLMEREERRDIALERAVGLDGDEAAGGAETLLLSGDDVEVLRVQFRDDHGDVFGVAMCAVVRNDRNVSLCVLLFESRGGFFGHVDSTEDEVDHLADLLDVVLCVHDDDVLELFRHRGLELPFGADGVFVRLAGRTGTGRERNDVEPRMTREEGGEALTDHAGGADDTYVVLFHVVSTSFEK